LALKAKCFKYIIELFYLWKNNRQTSLLSLTVRILWNDFHGSSIKNHRHPWEPHDVEWFAATRHVVKTMSFMENVYDVMPRGEEDRRRQVCHGR
jgi:hypothetical protein